jgi:hypothetical protein
MPTVLPRIQLSEYYSNSSAKSHYVLWTFKHFKSEIFEIFCNSVEGRKIIFKRYFFSIGHQRPTKGDYIGGEKFFLDTPGDQGSHPKTGLSSIGKTHLCP